MSTTLKPISAEQVAVLKKAGVIDSFADLEKSDYFIEYETVGSVNASAPAKVNEELVAHIEALRTAGRSETKTGKPLKTADGRAKVILGDKENLGGYRVMITGTLATPSEDK